MTISTTSNKAQWQGNGSATVFSFSFYVGSASQTALYYEDASGNISLIPSNQYSLAGLGSPGGGTVTYPLSGSPIASGTSLTLLRVVPLQQLVDLANQDNFYPDAVEGGLDYQMMALQQLDEQIGRQISAPPEDPSPQMTLPSAALRANLLMAFDANGNVTVATGGTSASAPYSGSVSNQFAVKDASPGAQQALSAKQVAAAGGAALVGTADGSTLQSLLSGSLAHMVGSVSDVAALDPSQYEIARTTGYYPGAYALNIGQDAGSGAYVYSSGTPLASGNGGSIVASTFPGASGCWLLVCGTEVSVKQFGAKGDGSTDDSAAVTAAHTFAQSVKCKLRFPHGTYVLKASYTLYIDQTSWVGDDATLDFTGLTGTGFALTLDSTSSYANQAQQVRYALQGIKLHGGTSTSRGTASGIFFGNSAGNAYVSCFAVDSFAVEGFATNISFGSNVWKLRMSNGIVRWGAITVPSGLTNFGEGMVFDNVFFADTDTFSPTPSIQLGEWHFHHCSLDNFEIDISNGANVFFEGCHFEKPGLAGAVANSYLRLTGGQNTTVRLSNCEIVGGYSSVTKAPFYVDDSITSGGLYFAGCLFPNSANINLSAETRTDKLLFEDMMVCGKGRATFTDCRTTFIPSTPNYSGCSSSYNANLVNNGNLASGAVAPFTQQSGPTQTAPSISADSNSPTGKVCTIPTSTQVATCIWRTNKVAVVPGQVVSALLVGGIAGLQSGDSGAFNLVFEDSAGNSIAPTPSLYQTTGSNIVPYVTLYPNSTVAPDGAVVAYIQLQIVVGASAGTREWSIGAASLTVL